MALIFDLDGTLIDSLPGIAAALNAVLLSEGLPPLTNDRVRRLIGDGLEATLRRALAEEVLPPELVHASARESAHESGHADILDRLWPKLVAQVGDIGQRLSQPYASVPELLAELAASGRQMAVCTNKRTNLSQDILRTHDLARYFIAIVGADQVVAGKPDPRHVEKCLELLDVAAREAVLIGDGVQDGAAAAAAGCEFIAADYGYGDLRETDAGARLTSFAELPAALARLESLSR